MAQEQALKKEKKQKKHEIDMIEGPILSRMLVFAFPLVCSNILQLLFNAADIIVVGRFGSENSLAAVGSTSSLINLLVNLFVGLAIGCNVLTARYQGARKESDVSETVHTSIALSIVSGVAMGIIGIVVAAPILEVMETPEEVLPFSTLYMRIYFLGMPAMMIYNFGSAVLIAGIINVVLNLFFVIVLQLDVAGVAAATSISQCFSAFMILRCLIKEEGPFRLHFKLLRIHKNKMLRILEIGLPAGFQGVLFALSNVIIQASINSFGKDVMAGSAASANIENFTYFAMNAFYQAAISFTSQNMGAGKLKRIHRIVLTATGCAAVTGLIFGSLSCLFGRQLLSIYSPQEVVVEEGIKRLFYIAAPYFICGIMDTMAGVIRGLGYSILPMIVSLLGACVLRIIWIQAFCSLPAFHYVENVYVSYPVTWTITLTAHIICYLIIMRRLKKRPEMQEAQSAA